MTSTSTPNGTPKTLSALAKYKEMRASGASDSQIRLRMANDGVPSDVADMFLSAAPPLSLGASSGSLGGDRGSPDKRARSGSVGGPRTSEFRRMLASGVPAASVRQKMARQGMLPQEINEFFASNPALA